MKVNLDFLINNIGFGVNVIIATDNILYIVSKNDKIM